VRMAASVSASAHTVKSTHETAVRRQRRTWQSALRCLHRFKENRALSVHVTGFMVQGSRLCGAWSASPAPGVFPPLPHEVVH